MTVRIFQTLCLIATALAMLTGCIEKESKYKVSLQPPADYINCPKCEHNIVHFDETGCKLPQPFEGRAYEYLQALTSVGDRHTGTQACRCGEIFIKNMLTYFGYQVEELPYTFPFYDFDPQAVHVKRIKDGQEFAAYPMHYSGNANGVLKGKVVRSGGDLKGNFVYVHHSMISGLLGKHLYDQYEKWKAKGAIGMIMEADLKPLATKGLPHSANAHAESWHYSVLPGFVVGNAKELIGETIEVSAQTRIVPGTGFSVVARSRGQSDQYVLVTAHLDSWFQGALDDGTGIAALLEIARLLKDDNKGLIFLAADSEELGLLGSAAYVQHFGTKNIAAVLELDMVSTKYNYGDRTTDSPTIMPRIMSYTKGLKPMAKKYFMPLAGREYFVSANLNRSVFGSLSTDMEWFYLEGVPGVFVYTPSKYYHTQRDTMEWIPEKDLQAVSEAGADLVKEMREKAGSLPRPKEIIPFSAEVKPAQGDTVQFEVRINTSRVSQLVNPPAVKVQCFFQQGYEDKVKLKKDKNGVWRADYRLPWPGEWQFLASVSQGSDNGKKWLVLTVPEK